MGIGRLYYYALSLFLCGLYANSHHQSWPDNGWAPHKVRNLLEGLVQKTRVAVLTANRASKTNTAATPKSRLQAQPPKPLQTPTSLPKR